MATVLVVDDDDDIRDSLADVLVDEGFDVLTAPHGLAALAVARNARPDLIVLDVMMPVMDGYEFRANQLTDVAIAAIPVVVITASRQAAKRLAPLPTLIKPVDIAALVELLRRSV
ncbi:MAG TPA: response regulator [Minicystis sp.]|nr:response regulator [Minicystis sp.]